MFVHHALFLKSELPPTLPFSNRLVCRWLRPEVRSPASVATFAIKIDDFDILVAIGGIERALKAVGHDVKLGAGLAAVQEYLGS